MAVMGPAGTGLDFGRHRRHAGHAAILTALDRLADKGLNLQKATPASWNLAGAGTLAAYQVTLNALETE